VTARLPLLLIITALCLAPGAEAHTVLFQRLVHVRVQPESVEVAMAVVIHAGPEALRLRQRFDRDGDEELSRDEQDQLANWMDSESFRDFSVSIGGDPLSLDGRARYLQLTQNHRADLGEGLKFRTVREGHVALRQGARQVVIHEAPGNGREMIAVRLDLHEGITLTKSDGREGASRLVPAAERSWQALVRAVPGDLVLELDVAATSTPSAESGEAPPPAP